MTLIMEDVAARLAPVWRGLSARLLTLTIAVIMFAEVLIFIPSAANFRTAWLMERVERGHSASLALVAAPDFEVSEELARELFANTEVHTVAVRGEVRELIWRGPPMTKMPHVVDLREQSLWRALVDTCLTFTAPQGRYLRVVDTARVPQAEFIEVIIPEAPLKEALWAYSARIFWLSAFISIMTGTLVFAALAFLFVRPMRALADAMTRFREGPDDPLRVITPSGRQDEIGQAQAELKLMQDQVRAALRQRERLAALGEAVAKINHDLRNILTAAQLVSDRLAANPDPSVRAQAARLVRAIDRGARLAEDVLAYGRSEERPPSLGPVPLRAAVEEAFADASAAASLSTGVDLRIPDDVVVKADPEHVHRIFVNIMRNAVQAIAAEEGRASPGVLTVSATANGAWVAADIADDGPGVPERARERLFTPFAASTRKGGTGLGLSIARELARANAGEVELAATGPHGTTFQVRLPRNGAEEGD